MSDITICMLFMMSIIIALVCLLQQLAWMGNQYQIKIFDKTFKKNILI